MPWLLDTHAAVWLAEASPRLPARIRRVLAPATVEKLLLLDVSLSEAARLALSGKIQFPIPADQALRQFARTFTVVPVSADIAWCAANLDWTHRDPCDRHILAAAVVLGVPLVTADFTITAFAKGVGVAVEW